MFGGLALARAGSGSEEKTVCKPMETPSAYLLTVSSVACFQYLAIFTVSVSDDSGNDWIQN